MDPGRTDGATPIDPGRTDAAAPVDPGRTDAPTHLDPGTGRTESAPPAETGRVDPGQVAPPPPPAPLDREQHELPDGRRVALMIVSAGPVQLEGGGRVAVRAFRLEAEPARLVELARFLDARLAVGDPIDAYLPGGEQGDALRRYLQTGAEPPAVPLARLAPEAEAAFLTWRGLRPLKPEQRARAAAVLGLPDHEVRGALPLR